MTGNSLQDVLDAIRRLRSGMKRQGPEIGYATEIDRIWDELCKIATTCSRAHQQIGILADMLDDGIGPKNDENRAKYIAGEIRKNLELLP